MDRRIRSKSDKGLKKRQKMFLDYLFDKLIFSSRLVNVAGTLARRGHQGEVDMLMFFRNRTNPSVRFVGRFVWAFYMFLLVFIASYSRSFET